MDRAFEHPMTVRILLPEDSDVVKSSKGSTVRYCGQAVEGDLEVTTASDFSFEIDVSFEGLVRTWLGPNSANEPGLIPQTAEFQFLRETQHISSNSSTGCCRGHLYVHRLPFQFIIPHELISARSDVHSNFLRLSPSTNLGCAFLGPTTGKAYKQPNITYLIRVIRVQTEIALQSPIRCLDEREIAVMPYASAAPPIETEHFPHEYKPYAMTAIKQHMWKRALGHLYISAEEPAPLNISTVNPRASAIAPVRLTFVPKPSCEIELCPCEWKLTVKYCLRTRTFYSTHQLERAPTASDTRTNSYLRMRERRTAWEVRSFGGVKWERDDSSEEGSSLRRKRWATSLVVPVNAAKDLLPTFLNALSSRQYSLVIRLMIEKFHHGVIEVVIPVQVINYPAEIALLGADTGTEPPYQEFDPASLSPLSNESMILHDGGDFDLVGGQTTFPPSYDFI